MLVVGRRPKQKGLVLPCMACLMNVQMLVDTDAATVLTCAEGGLRVHQLSHGAMGNFQYLLQVEERAIAVDAAWDIQGIKRYVDKRGLKIAGGLYTHRHADHVGGSQFGSPAIPGAADLRVMYGEAGGEGPLPVWIGARDAVGAAEASKLETSSWTLLHEGNSVDIFGDASVSVEVLDTPGHTEGGVSLLVRATSTWADNGPCGDGLLFTGDTLFVEAAGRTDLPGGDEQQLLKSLSRLTRLPGRTVVLPGHAYGPRPRSSLRKERTGNSFLRRAEAMYPPETLPPLPQHDVFAPPSTSSEL